MNPEFWLERWRLGEIGFNQSAANPDLLAYWASLRLPAGATAFVPLCGKSIDLAWLGAQGHRVIGIELAPQAVLDFFAEQALTATVSRRHGLEYHEAGGIGIYCADFFALQAAHLADVAAVYDRAALIALPPELRQRYARHLQQILPAGAQILQLTMEYTQALMNGPPFSVAEAELLQLYGAAFELTALGSRDLLELEPRFRQRGLLQLHERSYRLTPRSAG